MPSERSFSYPKAHRHPYTTQKLAILRYSYVVVLSVWVLANLLFHVALLLGFQPSEILLLLPDSDLSACGYAILYYLVPVFRWEDGTKLWLILDVAGRVCALIEQGYSHD